MLGPPGPLRLEERLGCEKILRFPSLGKLGFRVQGSGVDGPWVEESSRGLAKAARLSTLSCDGRALWIASSKVQARSLGMLHNMWHVLSRASPEDR